MGCGASVHREVQEEPSSPVAFAPSVTLRHVNRCPLNDDILERMRVKLIRFSQSDIVQNTDGQTDLDKLFAFADFNGDGLLSFVEFLRMCGSSSSKQADLTHEECKALFWHLDKDDSKGIDSSELHEWLLNGHVKRRRVTN